MFFMVLFRVDSLALAEQRWGGIEFGAQGVMELDGASVSGGGVGNGGWGMGRWMVLVFTKLFSLSYFREGVSECSERGSRVLGRETEKVAGWTSRVLALRDVNIPIKLSTSTRVVWGREGNEVR